MLSKNKLDGTLFEQLTTQECSTFLRKFRGTMLFRGFGSLSHKLFNKILIILKRRFGIDPSLSIERAILNLLPFVGYAPKKRGRKVVMTPLLLKTNRKYVLMNEWLLRKQRGKTNVRGIKIKDVARGFAECIFKRGNVFNLRADYIKKALRSRYVLMQRGRRRKTKGFFRLKKIVLERIRRKTERDNKLRLSKKSNLGSDKLKNSMYSMTFLRRKNKNKKYKKAIISFKETLFSTWNTSVNNKLKVLKDWAVEHKFKVPINFDILNSAEITKISAKKKIKKHYIKSKKQYAYKRKYYKI